MHCLYTRALAAMPGEAEKYQSVPYNKMKPEKEK